MARQRKPERLRHPPEVLCIGITHSHEHIESVFSTPLAVAMVALPRGDGLTRFQLPQIRGSRDESLVIVIGKNHVAVGAGGVDPGRPIVFKGAAHSCGAEPVATRLAIVFNNNHDFTGRGEDGRRHTVAGSGSVAYPHRLTPGQPLVE